MPDLTPEELALVRETAAILEADVRVQLGDGPIIGAALKAALIESVRTFSHPLDVSAIRVELDTAYANRLNVLVPADWWPTISGT